MLPPPVELCIPDAAFLHEEHFPGAPCVPGSCLLEAVRRAAVQAFGRPVICMAQARFRQFVPPGCACRLLWKHPAGNGAPAAALSGGAETPPRRVGWQLVAATTAGHGAPGGRLAEGEVWLAAGDRETTCD